MRVIKEYSGIKVTVNEEDLEKENLIYLLEFPNGKVYIGQTTKKFRIRIGQHCGTASRCRKLKNAIQKHHEFKAQVISSNLTTTQLDLYETIFIKAYDSAGKDGYNLETGGKNKTHATETRIILSQRIFSDETKSKMAECKKTKIKSIPDNIVFESVREAEVYYSIGRYSLYRYYDGKINQKSGQTFIKI